MTMKEVVAVPMKSSSSIQRQTKASSPSAIAPRAAWWRWGRCATILVLLCLLVVGDSLLHWVLCLSIGVWIAAWIQNGTEGVSYCGSQLALAFLVTLVQGSGPPDQFLSALQRLEGVAIGLIVLNFVTWAWPLSKSKTEFEGRCSLYSAVHS